VNQVAERNLQLCCVRKALGMHITKGLGGPTFHAMVQGWCLGARLSEPESGWLIVAAARHANQDETSNQGWLQSICQLPAAGPAETN